MDTEAQDIAERDRPPDRQDREGRSLSAVRHWWRGRGPWQEAALLLAVCCTVVLLVAAFLVQPFLVPSGSMENTVRIGDRVLVDKLAYRFGGAPRRGDVIVFDGTGSFVQDVPARDPVSRVLSEAAGLVGLARSGEPDYVKRVVGIGGDRVTCCDKRGRITVNGWPVTEDYLHPGDVPSRDRFDIVVPPDQLWVMGDHRSVSSDSRAHLGDPGGGTVPVDEVIGRVEWIAWPPGRIRELPRSSAFSAVPSPSPAGAHG